MPRLARLIVTVFGRPAPPPLPVVTAAPSPAYRACAACGVEWRGDEDCWSPTYPSQPIPAGGTMTDDDCCPFCGRIKRGEYDYDDRWSVAFQPLNPVTPGHFLAVPRKHTASAATSPLAAGRAFQFAAELARLMELDDFNLISSAGSWATQTVFHLHVHVVPRREGDGLALPWTGQKITTPSPEGTRP